MSDCPRCYGSNSIVCCALCNSTGYVDEDIAEAHYLKAHLRWPSIEWCKDIRSGKIKAKDVIQRLIGAKGGER